MTIHFSPGTGAFYDSRIWPHDLPPDVLGVSFDRHVELIEALALGRQIALEQGALLIVDAPLPSAELLAVQARSLRDAYISQIRWIIDRHRDEKALGRTTTLTDEDYQLVLDYVQQLRDLPEQENFPHQIDWPVLPAELLETGP